VPSAVTAAVIASNYTVALLAAAQEIMIAAGVAPADALNALAPLARTSLENAICRGPAAALTGPIERGDTSTVAAHVRALDAASAATRLLYSAAGLRALELARHGGLPPGTAAEIESILKQELSRK
jgi:predicted short-subunit dehydrogenase-like oxidoreductase (DUF2520 family)